MKKITFVTGSMSRGGAERVISVLSNYLVDHGYDISIIMLLHSFNDYNLDKRIKIIDLSNDKKKIALYMPELILKLRRYLSKHDMGTLVCFMAQICLITGLAIKGKKIDMISCERIDPHHVHRNPAFEKVLNNIYSTSKHTVFQNTTERDYFPENIQNSSVIIPNPIQIHCPASDDKKKKIVAVGRLTDQKNHKMLISAFSKICKADSEYTLDIYGDGPLKDELTALSESLGIKENVILHGSVLNVHDEICDAEIFVLSSDFEGLSNALLEAMMMGLPCISTNCAGSGDAIVDGESGLLVPVGDENAILGAMQKLIDDKELAGKLGKNAKERAEKLYSVENVVNQWIDIIEN